LKKFFNVNDCCDVSQNKKRILSQPKGGDKIMAKKKAKKKTKKKATKKKATKKKPAKKKAKKKKKK